MPFFPVMLRSLRPSPKWIEQELKMMQQMEAIVSSTIPARPSYYIEWHDPWVVDEKTNEKFEVAKKEKDAYRPYILQLNVKNFSPQEITVKTVDSSVIVEGKHEEASDEKGFVSRHFVRTFTLPDGHAAEDVVSSISPEGLLTITSPSKATEEKEVPIQENQVDDNQK